MPEDEQPQWTGPVRSPLQWVGGKRAEAQYLAGLLPPHRCYVEVFGGAASVLLAKQPSPVEVYNDLNGELVNFFRVLKEQPEAFKTTWRYCLVSREEFQQHRAADVSRLTPVERAYRFLYLNRTSFGADMVSPVFGIGASGRSSLVCWLENFEQWTDAVHRRLRACYLEHEDWRRVLARWDEKVVKPPGMVFFCDPPYLGLTGYQVGAFSEHDHRDLARYLRQLRGRFLLTINDHPTVRQLYHGYPTIERKKNYSVSRAARGRGQHGELIIASYQLPGT